jgi:anti-sigma regulatory factor (Ser/Thr protein kinase)
MAFEPNPEVIEITFPASSRFIRLSRLAAATLAAELGFDVEEADDVRIAVDELVTLLVEGSPPATVMLRFRLAGDRLEVEGSVEGPGVAAVEVSDLVEAILSATTDEHDFSSADGARSFGFTKCHPDPDGHTGGAGLG